MNGIKIIVVGNTHHNTLSMVRSLGRWFGKVDLMIVGSGKSYIESSRYVGNVYHIAEEIEIPSFLLSSEEKLKGGILITCSDKAAYVIDLAYDSLLDRYRVFNCGRIGFLAELMDKHRQASLAAEYGLKVPESRLVSVSANGETVFPCYPCIVKPDKSYAGGKNLLICGNQKDLDETLSNFPDNTDLLVQRAITKKHEIVLPGVSVNGKVEIPGVVWKIRENTGATTYSEVCSHDDATRELATRIGKLVENISYTGLFGAEFIFDGNDYYFIELNLRNDATCFSLEACGVSLPAYYVESILGHNPEMKPVTEEVYSIVEFNDFSNVLRRKIGLGEWLRDYRRATCKFYNARDDKRAYYKALCYWLDQWILKKIRR